MLPRKVSLVVKVHLKNGMISEWGLKSIMKRISSLLVKINLAIMQGTLYRLVAWDTARLVSQMAFSGENYGIPIQKILKWHWDFVVCCFLLLISLIICFAGLLLILTLKYIPSILLTWSNLARNAVIGCWPYILMAVLLTPLGIFVLSVIGIAAGTAMSFRVPATYLAEGYFAGFQDPFDILYEVDRSWCFDVGHVFPERRENRLPEGSSESSRGNQRNHQTAEESKLAAEAYWDRFTLQCIQTTSCLLSKRWISSDDVLSMEPSLIEAIPAIAILEILVDTANDSEAHNDEDILWKIDGVRCKAEDRPRHDNIATLLWPKVMCIKRLLDQKMKTKMIFTETQNVQVLQAMICSNAEDALSDLKAFVEASKVGEENQPNSSVNKEIRSKLIELTLILHRLRPFQDRMKSIFEHEYDIEMSVRALLTAAVEI